MTGTTSPFTTIVTGAIRFASLVTLLASFFGHGFATDLDSTSKSGSGVETLERSTGIVLFESSTTAADALGSAADDTIILTDETNITGVLEGAGGADILSVLGNASVDRGVYGGGNGNDGSAAEDGADTITIETTNAVRQVDGGLGDDTIDLLSGTVTLEVRGQQGADTITLDGATIGNRINGDDGADSINLVSGSTNFVFGQEDNDEITLSGATVKVRIDGGTGMDTINLNSGSVSSVQSGDDDDDITLNGAAVNGSIDGGNGNDSIDLLSGTVATEVRGKVGNDVITLRGATVKNRINGDEGNDSISLISGQVNFVFGGDNDDEITLDEATVAVRIDGGNGEDKIYLNSSSVSSVLGAGDDDEITLNGTTINGNLDGGSGSDLFDLQSGSTNFILAGDGDDTITLNGADVRVRIDCGNGSDEVNLLSGTVATSVRAQEGNDTITLDGATVNVRISGGPGNDLFYWHSGSVPSFLGEDGSDTLVVSATEFGNNQTLDGGDNDDASNGIIDRLTLRNQSIEASLRGARIVNWEEISFVDSNLEVDDLITGTVKISGGTTTLGGTSVVTDVLGSSDDETVIVTDNTGVTNVIEGAGGSDTLSVQGNASVAGGVYGSGAGNDASAADDGADTITINTTGTVQLVDSGAGNDTIDWQSGSVAELHGGNGSDTVEVSAAEYDNTQILDGGGDNDDEANGVVDQLTLRGLGIDLADNNTISNWEVIVFDASTINFTDGTTATSAALFLTNGSILNGDDEFNHDGNLTIDGGSRFRGTGAGLGTYQVQELANNGTVDLQDAAVGDTFTTLGDYSGSGALLLDVDLGHASSDILKVEGDVSGGTTAITAQTIEIGPDTRKSGASSRIGTKILLVDVLGTTEEGDFYLTDSIREGTFSYFLELENSQWLLAPGLNSQAVTPSAAPSILLDAFTKLPTFSQRTGGRQWLWRVDETEGKQAAGRGVWLRFSGDHIDATPEVNVGAFNGTYHYDSDIRNTQTGIETRLPEGPNGQWILGLTAQYGSVDAVVSNRLGRGSVEATGYGAGLTATWQGNNGLYLDTQGQFNWIDSEIASAADGRLIDGHASSAQSLSLELGRRFSINGRHSIIPQMQLSWGRVDGDRFTDSLGSDVDPGSNESLTARFGMAYNFQLKDADGKYRKNLYVVGNLMPNFSEDSKVKIGQLEVASENDPTYAEIGLGGSFALNRNTSLYAEGSRREAVFDNSDDEYGYSFSVGMNVRW